MTDRELSRALTIIAEDLDGRLYPPTGIIRRAAQRLAQLAADTAPPAEAPRCLQCGEQLPPVDAGKPGAARRYCGSTCRSRARRRAQRDATDSAGWES